MAYAAIAAGLLSAGGAVAGGLLAPSQTANQGDPNVGAPGSNINPALQAAQFETLLAFGVVDATSLQLASPLSRLMASVAASPNYDTGQKAGIFTSFERAFRLYGEGVPIGTPNTLNGSPVPGFDALGNQAFTGDITNVDTSHLTGIPGSFLPVPSADLDPENFTDPSSAQGKIDAFSNTILGLNTFSDIADDVIIRTLMAESGFTDLQSLFDAEADYQTQIAPIINRAQGSATANLVARLDAQRQINSIIGDLPDASASGIASLKASEKSRILRDLNLSLDEQQADILAIANAGNFNPGRPLGDIEEFRGRATQDADLEALSRAITLIGGQQNLANNNIGSLQNFLQRDIGNAATLANIDMGVAGGTINFPAPIPNSTFLSEAIVSAGVSAGNAIQNFAELRKPAVE